jgi:hypothetical protein
MTARCPTMSRCPPCDMLIARRCDSLLSLPPPPPPPLPDIIIIIIITIIIIIIFFIFFFSSQAPRRSEALRALQLALAMRRHTAAAAADDPDGGGQQEPREAAKAQMVAAWSRSWKEVYALAHAICERHVAAARSAAAGEETYERLGGLVLAAKL